MGGLSDHHPFRTKSSPSTYFSLSVCAVLSEHRSSPESMDRTSSVKEASVKAGSGHVTALSSVAPSAVVKRVEEEGEEEEEEEEEEEDEEDEDAEGASS